MSDKRIEFERYEKFAEELLAEPLYDVCYVHGSSSMPRYLATPYIKFEEKIKGHIHHDSLILEIGSGTGVHTGSLLEAGGIVIATDISGASLRVLRNRYKEYEVLNVCASDMESLPFKSQSFDVVVSAGSMSYGEPNLVMHEIYRVLKHKGVFICVDSLSDNPIYRLNRWIHYIRGSRSKSTLNRMPNLATINRYAGLFQQVDASFHGSITWLLPLLKIFIGESFAKLTSDLVDRALRVKRSAFKFVMVAKK